MGIRNQKLSITSYRKGTIKNEPRSTHFWVFEGKEFECECESEFGGDVFARPSRQLSG